MQQTPEFKEKAKLTQIAMKDMFRSLFGTVYTHQYFGLVMVLFSIILALIVPYEGLFITSQSQGMTNYHRWLYDVFVIVNTFLGFVIFYMLKRQKYNIEVKQKWRVYITAHAQFKFHRYLKAQEKGKKPLMHTRFGEYFFVLITIIFFIAVYSLMTPSGTSHRGFIILTWWPMNASIIAVIYTLLFIWYFRLFAIHEIMNQYKLLIRRGHAWQQDQ